MRRPAAFSSRPQPGCRRNCGQLAHPAPEADATPGEYRLLVGLYHPVSGERLAAVDGAGQSLGDAVQLTVIHFEATPQ